MSSRPITYAIAAASAVAAAFPLLAQGQAKPAPPVPAAISAGSTGAVAIVNGVAIPQQREELVLREATQQGQTDTQALRARVRDELINREIISQEATKIGVTKRADIQNELELARQTTIVQIYIREYLRTHPITDAEIQKEYDAIKTARGDKEFKTRHILVGTEGEARDVIAELKKGVKFEDIAKKSSKDEGSKGRGGELGWVAPGQLDKDFSDAFVKLSKGKYTENPVKTRFGFHVILVDDVRAASMPPLAEVKSNLVGALQRQRVERNFAELRQKAKVE